MAVCTKQYPEIDQLPVPIQKLLAIKLDTMTDHIAKGKEISSTSYEEALSLRRYCKFYGQYLLPCRHIIHLDTELEVLTPSRWKVYIMMFDGGI